MIFKYNVKYYDEFEDKEIELNGLVAAKTFPEATEILSIAFGEKNISKISLKWLTDNSYIIFTNNVKDINNIIEKVN